MQCGELGNFNHERNDRRIESKMCVVSSKLGVTKMVVIALVVSIVVVGIVAAYIVLQLPSSSPTPTPTPTPTVYTHNVDWVPLANGQADYWNITINQPYRFVANDTLTVSSGDQLLGITAKNSQNSYPIWYISYYNATYFLFDVWYNASYFHQAFGYCNSGIVSVVANGTSITFIGTSQTVVSGLSFRQLDRIVTTNDDGSFNGGQVDYKISV
jgi:hypothetical protein